MLLGSDDRSPGEAAPSPLARDDSLLAAYYAAPENDENHVLANYSAANP